MNEVIGQCSICGGDVVQPIHFHSVKTPRPYCERCGAVMKDSRPIVEMEPLPAKEAVERIFQEAYRQREAKGKYEDLKKFLRDRFEQEEKLKNTFDLRDWSGLR